MKAQLITSLIFFAAWCQGQNSLYNVAWASTQNVIHYCDSAASMVIKQKHHFKCKTAKINVGSPDSRKIKVNRKIKYKNGIVLLREKYRTGSNVRIWVFKIAGMPHMIKAKFKNGCFHEDIESSTFTRLRQNIIGRGLIQPTQTVQSLPEELILTL